MPYTRDGIPFQKNSNTSLLAAESVAPTVETQRQEILLFIQRRGERGATDEEVRDGMGILMNSINPRRGELVKLGLVANSGEMRLTRQNRWATVWKAIEHCSAIPVLSKSDSLRQENVRLKEEVEQLRAALRHVQEALRWNDDREEWYLDRSFTVSLIEAAMRKNK